jgi:hypothetical protein
MKTPAKDEAGTTAKSSAKRSQRAERNTCMLKPPVSFKTMKVERQLRQ